MADLGSGQFNPEEQAQENVPTQNQDSANYLNRAYLDEVQGDQQKDDLGFYSKVAMGLGAVALGWSILGQKTGRGIMANLLEFLGKPKGIGIAGEVTADQAAGNLVRPGQAGLYHIFNRQLDVRTGRAAIQQLDLVRDVVHALDMQQFGGDYIHERLTEFINRKYANRAVGFFDAHLDRLTLGRVLDNQQHFTAMLGGEGVNAIRSGMEAGLLHRDLVLDPKIYSSRATGHTLDLRRPGGFLFNWMGPLNVFGQRSTIEAFRGAREGVAVVSPREVRQVHPYITSVGQSGTYSRTFTFPRVFIGGSVHELYRDPVTGDVAGRVVSQNMKLARSVGFGGGGASALRTVRELRHGTLEYITTGQGWDAVQDTVGIGAKWRTTFSFLEKFVTNPIRRLAGLARGEAVIYRSNYHASGHPSVFDHVLSENIDIADASAHIRRVPGGGQFVDWRSLSWREKFATLFDNSDTLHVLNQARVDEARAQHQTLSRRELHVLRPSGSIRSTTDVALPGSLGSYLSRFPPRPTLVGELPRSRRASFYATERGWGVGLRDAANYMVLRLNTLASDTGLGIALKPSNSFVVNATRLAMIPLAYEVGRQYLGYADYLSKKYTGFSPVETAADIYTSLRVAQQKAREWSGIQQGTAWLEKNFPGSIDSGFGYLARSVAAPAAAFLAGSATGNLFRGLAAAVGTFAAIGGASVAQPSQELQEEYSGERKIPVREGRFWGMGFLPFEGGRVQRYSTSWYAKLKSGARTKSIYGSDDEYYTNHFSAFGLPLPGGHNLLGLRNLSDPYRLERMHAADRPYPVSGPWGEEIPLFGPMIAATIGRIIKPPKYRTEDDLPLMKAGLVDRGLSPTAAQDMGIPSVDAGMVEAQDPHSILYRIQRQADIAAEPTGLYKFVLGYFGVKFAPAGAQLADAGAIGSNARAFYDMAVGGAFGQTEFLRRFVVSNRYRAYLERDKANSIRNQMPDWMPGTDAKEDYFIDFRTGDPYAKIEEGELRLPGAGYEALNGTHSGTAGVYDLVDQFLILADTAPYSKAAKQKLAMLMKLKLDQKTRQKIERAAEQMQEIQAPHSKYPRFGERPEDANASPLYAAVRRTYDTVTHDFLAQIPFVGSKLAPFRSDLEQFQHEVGLGFQYADWNDPMHSIAAPLYRDMRQANPIMGAIKGGVIGGLLSHTGFNFFNPFTALHTEGGMFHPLAAGIGAAVGATASLIGPNADNGDGFEYMDKFIYLRNRALQEEALAQGNDQLASQFGAQASKTLVGARTRYDISAALPSPLERRYFRLFQGEQNTERREALLQAAPKHFGYALSAVWSGSYAKQDQADEAALGYFQDHPMPSAESLVWNPSVPNEAVKMKLSNDGLGGLSDHMHKHVFYESERIEMRGRFPDLDTQETNFVWAQPPSTIRDFSATQMRRVRDAEQNITTRTIGSTPYRQGTRYYVDENRRADVLAAAQEAMRR